MICKSIRLITRRLPSRIGILLTANAAENAANLLFVGGAVRAIASADSVRGDCCPLLFLRFSLIGFNFAVG